MPFYGNVWGGNEGMSSIGSNLGELMYRRKLLDLEAERWQQEMAFRNEQLGLSRERLNAEIPNLTAEAAARRGGETREQSVFDQAQRTGRAAMLRSLITKNPTLGSDPGTLGEAVTLLRGQNLMPQGPVSLSRTNLAQALEALMTGSAVGNVMTVPAAAERLMRPTELGPNTIGISPFTGEEMGRGPVMERAGAGVRGIHPGYPVYTAEGQLIGTAPGDPYAGSQTPWGSIFGSLGKAAENPEFYDPGLLKAMTDAAKMYMGSVLGKMQGTNAPAGGAPQTGYLVGRQYGNMVYLGGDPNEESSWRKAQ